MQIFPNIKIINLALWLKKERVLLISDLHLGYEEYLQQKGVFLPKFQIKTVIESLKKILAKVKPKTIVINGDLKHDFGRILKQEWKDVLKIIDLMLENCEELILVRGNHDTILGPIAEKRKIKIVKDYQIKNILIIHGDKLIEKTKAKTIIIGHEHPAVTIRDGSKFEKYKCFLKGKWCQKAKLSGTSRNMKSFQKKNKTLIVMPSFNPLIEGTDIIKEQLLSPFLTNISNFEVFIVGKEEVFPFGKVKSLP
ncbi:MAG: metallophosphoesterase [Nanoarchaeota archaeon]|nr:metallophosphoesterase [Nanoarchaeota archaeon]MBU1622088.1 metallophosphoesterase [Nanoarchaeota archaeon]MBU1973878.1 metallophosphoesterase [Nanoarchaeota archaeon]